MTNIFVSEQAVAALSAAALEIQQRLGAEEQHLSQETVDQTLRLWLETSLESLAEDALWHCMEGDRAQVFNRRAFENGLRRAYDRSGPT